MANIQSFKEFIAEQSLYRGHDYTHPVVGDQKIVWFAYDRATADGYAKHRDNPTVSVVQYKPKKTIKLGTTNRTITAKSFADEIIAGSHSPSLDLRKVDPIVSKMVAKFGATQYSPVHFWNNGDLVAELVDVCGFDSIEIKDDGNLTLGVLNKYLSVTGDI